MCIDHGKKGYGMGYATAWLGSRPTTLHRKIFFEVNGYLPEVVRHTCDNPRCINPEHLIAGTQKDNVADMLTRNRQGDCCNFGTSNGRCALSDDAVAFIRQHYIKGSREFGLPALARRFNCGTSQVHRIVKGLQRGS